MMVAESLGISVDRIKSFACSLEFFHAASLIIDDIQDNSTERVGKKAIWTQIGKNRAIDAGFYLKDTGHRVFHKDISLFLAASQNLNDYIHKVSQEITIGQDMDLCASYQWRFGFSRYQEIASRKTGRLIGLSLCLPFLLVGKESEARILSDFGKALGIIHQLNDDIDDLVKILTCSPDNPPSSLDPGNIVFFSKHLRMQMIFLHANTGLFLFDPTVIHTLSPRFKVRLSVWAKTCLIVVADCRCLVVNPLMISFYYAPSFQSEMLPSSNGYQDAKEDRDEYRTNILLAGLHATSVLAFHNCRLNILWCDSVVARRLQLQDFSSRRFRYCNCCHNPRYPF